ncbi:hypothetical protein GYMLUDRAFT_605748 [Collybiopsis luxurians FD-317 M1]|uniref:Peptidase A1 domain-containing protein n=1 Tax=Collybiopsis luxurians FD-317 M1 TaxID=944289 RepID=A0A0D0B9M8_9AGAR|nr:hypothetical protein GYMLUDRAFT_605748 [Collybiopsis luxurians FD-317 M1]
MPSFSVPTLTLTVVYVLSLTASCTNAFPLRESPKPKRGVGFDIPFQRARSRGLERRDGDVTGEMGLGDNSDLLYTVPIQLGPTLTAVHLDTGSSDLWVTSSDCTRASCGRLSATSYDLTSFNASGSSVVLNYGDSTTGTSASGPIGFDTATLAGIAIQTQTFAAVNATTNTVVQNGAAGIFGLGFPAGSSIQAQVVEAQSGGSLKQTDGFIEDTYKYGPLLSRIAMTNQLENDVFAIALQRSEIDDGPDNGTLTIGKLPDGVDNSSLTWVPVRLYNASEGGLSPPSFAPNEIYPFRWEIDIDGVYLDGQLLPPSSIPATGGVDSSQVSALIDTGNSLIRGPSDVVNNILTTVSPNYNPSSSNSIPSLPCTSAHTLAFQIGGKMFPVDPRDFISDIRATDTNTCEASNVVSTDPPSVGALFRWSLGDPFMKNIVAFHYGNLTHPSVDPPRIGFLSTVPSNAAALLTQAVEDAQSAGGFDATTELAPTASAAAESAVTLVPTAPPTFISAAVASSATVTVSMSNGNGNSNSNDSGPSSGNQKSSNAARSLRLGGGSTLQSLCRKGLGTETQGRLGGPAQLTGMLGNWSMSVVLGMGVTLAAMVFT